jgi:hypothetical protein
VRRKNGPAAARSARGKLERAAQGESPGLRLLVRSYAPVSR